jgi:hypothetical protein
VAVSTAGLSDPQRRSVVEHLRVEAGRAPVPARNLLALRAADHGVQVSEPTRRALLDDRDAPLGAALAVASTTPAVCGRRCAS